MKIGTDTFRGEVPLLSARALPDAAAQEATNCRMKSGDLEAWRQFLLTYELVGTSGTQRTIYLLDDAWLSFTEQVDIARNVFSGGAAHRIFLTCPALYSTPQYTDKANATSGSPPFPTITFPLGLPGPTDIPTLVLGVDSTPTTFSIDTTDPGDVLETSWITSPTRAGSTFSAVTQEAAQGNPSPCYRLHYDEIHNLGEAPFMKRAFGIESASVIHVTAEMRFSGDTSVKNGFMSVAATTTGEGLMVGILSGTLQIRNGTSFEWYNSGAIDNVSAPGLAGGTWYTLDVTMVNNPAPANTQTVTLKLLDGVTEIATVTATNVFTIGGFVGFSAAIPDDSGSVYQTDIDNIHVQASGSTGITPNLTATNYVYTFVNDQGEESTPSFPTADILRPDGVTVNVTTSTTAPSGYEAATTLKRIYRLVSGTTGDLYRFVAEIPLAQADFLDDLTDNELSQTILESQNYDIPPPTLQGIIALPNGIYAGFFEKSLCLSVAGRPHAWPVRQRYPVDSDIVAICNIDNTIVIGTGTFVFTCTGTDPAAYSMSKPGAPQACLSKLGMTYLDGQGVVFPSPDGWCVCAGSAGFVPVMTDGIFTKEQWESYNPSSIVAAVHDGVLHWWYDTAPVVTEVMYLFHFNDDEFSGETNNATDQTGASWTLDSEAFGVNALDTELFKFGTASLKNPESAGGSDEVLERSSLVSFTRSGREFCLFDGWLHVDSGVLGEGEISGEIVRIETDTGIDLVLNISTFGGGALNLFPQDDGTTPATAVFPFDEWFHLRANFYEEAGTDDGGLYLWVNGQYEDATSFTTTGLLALNVLGPDIRFGPFGLFETYLRIDEAYAIMGTPINEDFKDTSFDVPTAEWPNP